VADGRLVDAIPTSLRGTERLIDIILGAERGGDDPEEA